MTDVDEIKISNLPRTLSDINIIHTVAGDGGNAFFGDGGQATSTLLRNPHGIAIDASGNLYFVDNYARSSRIRTVTKSTGIITTVAGNGTHGYSGDGGPATSATFNYPTGVALDTSDNIYIVDHRNSRIRMVARSTGIITTVAGNGTYGYSGDGGPATSAQLKNPRGVAVDGSGNIYIADSSNGCIRMVMKSTGVISTVAGSVSSHPGQHSGDGGPATSATFYYPAGVFVDESGNIYVADSDNNRIRLVMKSTGIITTVAGNGTYGYSGDGGPATSSKLYSPMGVFVDAPGNIYISERRNHRIRIISKSTGIISTVAGTGIYKNGGYSGDGGQATSAQLNSPTSVFGDASGNIYFVDTENNRIRMVAKSTGIISTVAGDGTSDYVTDEQQAKSAKLYFPSGIAFDTYGNTYIAEKSRIRMVMKSTGIITTVAGNGTHGYSGDGGPAISARLSNPTGVAVDRAGNIYMADSSNHRIRMVTKSTDIMTTVAGYDRYKSHGRSGDGGPATSTWLYYPTGVALDASGNIYIADSFNRRIRMVTKSTGIISTVAGTARTYFDRADGGLATLADLRYPTGVALDASGNIYIADSGEDRIRMVTRSSGIITTVAGNGTYRNAGYSGDGGQATSAKLGSPSGVFVDASGNIYIAISFNSCIRMVMNSTGIITTVAGNGISGYSGDGGPATSAALRCPAGVAVDRSGNIYIADTDNNRIRVLSTV